MNSPLPSHLKRSFAPLIISILIGFFTSGCAKDPVDPILGRWIRNDLAQFTEFLSTSNFLMSYDGPEETEILIGRWSKPSDDSFLLETERLGIPYAILWEDVRIVGDEMVVSIEGRLWMFTRIAGPR